MKKIFVFLFLAAWIIECTKGTVFAKEEKKEPLNPAVMMWENGSGAENYLMEGVGKAKDAVFGIEMYRIRGSEYITAGEDWLCDALFIGDSRTALLYEYSDWDMADYFVQYGMTIWDCLDTKIKTCEDYKGITVREALGKKRYGKIYIMLGINELGNEDAEGFYKQYAAVLGEIHKLQPDAVIFVQAILHVADKIDAQQYYINNQEINVRNEALSKITEEEGLGRVYWLDCNFLYDDENGKLTDEWSFDGIHVKPAYMYLWQDFLLSHAVP